MIFRKLEQRKDINLIPKIKHTCNSQVMEDRGCQNSIYCLKMSPVIVRRAASALSV